MGLNAHRFPTWAVMSLVLGGSLPNSPVDARVIRVPADFTTIQAGVDAAVAGDSILVTPGSYPEQVNIETAGITLVADGGEAVVESGVPVLAVRSSAVLIAGFSVIATSYLSGSPALLLDGEDLRVESCVMSGGWAGVLVLGQSEIRSSCICESEMGIQVAESGNQVTLADCDILNNRNLGVAGGVSVINGAMATLTDCRLIGNVAAIDGGAIYVSRGSSLSSTLVAERCVIAHNMSSRGAAVRAVYSNVILRSCTVVANEVIGSLGGGVLHFEGDPRLHFAQIENCIVAFNKGPALRCHAARLGISCCDVFGNGDDTLCGAYPGDNISLDPRFCNLGNDDFHLAIGSPCAPENAPAGCGLIGALDLVCTSAVLPVTWGAIKQRFKAEGAARAIRPGPGVSGKGVEP